MGRHVLEMRRSQVESRIIEMRLATMRTLLTDSMARKTNFELEELLEKLDPKIGRVRVVEPVH